MYKMLMKASALTTATMLLSGCLLITPYNNQVLSSRSSSIPFQAWTTQSGATLKVECMPTNRFGPDISSHGSWSQITTVTSSDDATRDLTGARRYSASKMMTLPQSCWYQNRSNGWYYSSIRVLQDDYLNADTFEYYTLNRSGIDCTAESVSTSGNHLRWLSDACQRKYSNSSNSIKWIVIRTDA